MGFHLKEINENELESVQRIFEEAPTYSLRVEGVLPKKDAASVALRDLPPNFSRDHKHCFGFYQDEVMIGFVDILNGYPEKGIAYLGLLLLSEKYHQKGLGRIAYQMIEAESKKWGTQKIRLSVAQTNDVTTFWKKMGFIPTGRILTAHDPNIISQVIEMDKNL